MMKRPPECMRSRSSEFWSWIVRPSSRMRCGHWFLIVPSGPMPFSYDPFVPSLPVCAYGLPAGHQLAALVLLFRAWHATLGPQSPPLIVMSRFGPIVNVSPSRLTNSTWFDVVGPRVPMLVSFWSLKLNGCAEPRNVACDRYI